ncbi:MAG: ATP/GTP-binding protein [Ruminococcaceae bacterium]|nr:ATP/GTP-binding protein [Oscillospiraceae bacterium]
MSSNLETLAYKIGGLLYSPAINTGVADKLAEGAYPCLTSIAFCLEDSILDCALEQAEQDLLATLTAISERVPQERMPLVFVRVRTPSHLMHISRMLGGLEQLLTGYILPKFDSSNGGEYAENITLLNRDREQPLYFMPIIESRLAASSLHRTEELHRIRNLLSTVQPYILNVRVGGNDFSNIFGVRRPIDRTIYDLGVIRDILVDISSVFSADYVVSGPVWEYFGTEGGAWAEGLRNELELDRLNGFTGKTAIHPSQLPVIYDNLKVTEEDYRDALSILGWESELSGVAKSADGGRMNEVKCHERWARKVKLLGDIYGIKELATV